MLSPCHKLICFVSLLTFKWNVSWKMKSNIVNIYVRWNYWSSKKKKICTECRKYPQVLECGINADDARFSVLIVSLLSSVSKRFPWDCLFLLMEFCWHIRCQILKYLWSGTEGCFLLEVLYTQAFFSQCGSWDYLWFTHRNFCQNIFEKENEDRTENAKIWHTQ